MKTVISKSRAFATNDNNSHKDCPKLVLYFVSSFREWEELDESCHIYIGVIKTIWLAFLLDHTSLSIVRTDDTGNLLQLDCYNSVIFVRVMLPLLLHIKEFWTSYRITAFSGLYIIELLDSYRILLIKY